MKSPRERLRIAAIVGVLTLLCSPWPRAFRIERERFRAQPRHSFERLGARSPRSFARLARRSHLHSGS
jgi:hypothetical protein